MQADEILGWIPYEKPFRFVDKILSVSENHIEGEYTFKMDEAFYQGHFPTFPITPGVILTEAMAQIGLVGLGIFLVATTMGKESLKKWFILLTDTKVEFSKPVFPGEKISVKSKKIFWRKMKLKCFIEVYNSKDELVCAGELAAIGVPNGN